MDNIETAVSGEVFKSLPMKKKIKYVLSHPKSKYVPDDPDLKFGQNWPAHNLYPNMLHHAIHAARHNAKAFEHLRKANMFAGRARNEQAPSKKARLHEAAGKHLNASLLHRDWYSRHYNKLKELEEDND